MENPTFESYQRDSRKTWNVIETNDPKKSNGSTNGNGSHHTEGSQNGDHSNGTSQVRAFLATPLQVSARTELKDELRIILGEGGFRFQAVAANQR